MLDDAVAWLEEDLADGQSGPPARERSVNRMCDQTAPVTEDHELDRIDASSRDDIDPKSDILMVAAAVASKAAFNTCVIAEAYERLTIPAFPGSESKN